MGKFLDQYQILKRNVKKGKDEKEVLYLFKNGSFFDCISNDATVVSSLLSLKLTTLGNATIKCGFPVNSLSKYASLLAETDYQFKIVDSNTGELFTPHEYLSKGYQNTIFKKILDIDLENINYFELTQIIENIQKEILENEKY